MVEPITTTLIIAGVSMAVVGVSAWGIYESRKQTSRSIAESERQRLLTEKALGAQESQFKVNTVLTIVGVIVALATLGFAVYTFTRPKGATT